MKKCLLFFLIFPLTNFLFAQKFHLRSGIGINHINWYEQEFTANFSSQLTYQKPGSSLMFVGELKTFGNIAESKVDPSTYVFIPYTPAPGQMPDVLNLDDLSSTYRGGSAELAIRFNQKNKNNSAKLIPELSVYSISFARKISTEKTHYVEEEKYGLHGFTGGLGIMIPGKVNIYAKSKLFVPVFNNFTLYGRYVGVPYENSNQEINVSYRNAVELTYKRFNLEFDYDIYHLGRSENLKSKTIPSSKNTIVSVYLNYLF